MWLILVGASIATLCLLVLIWMSRARGQRELERHSITPEDLHSLQSSGREVLIFDVRQPLDLLAYPEIIPGAKRIPPKDVLENPSLIPNETDSVVYCTCPSDKTSRIVLRRALALRFRRIKFLRGGLAGWKAKGYPVERYEEVFSLYSPPV
jgi:rhodanese-related sulfurtransferase